MPAGFHGMRLAVTRQEGKHPMKFIMAYIQPYKLEEVREALEKAGAHGITASDVKGHGRQRGHTEFYRGAEYKVSFASKIKLEIAVEDGLVDAVVQAIEEHGEDRPYWRRQDFRATTWSRP